MRSRRNVLGGAVRLAAISMVAGVGSWLAIPSDEPNAVMSTSPAPAHATWFRHESLKDLMKPTAYVVAGKVVAVEPYAPITAKDAGAAEGAPEIPRQIATLRVSQQYFGAKLEPEISVVQNLAPDDAVFSEDPPYRSGDELMLFLRDAIGPRSVPIPGALSRVGIDGLYRQQRDGRFTPALGGAPEAEVAAATRNPEKFREAKS